MNETSKKIMFKKNVDRHDSSPVGKPAPTKVGGEPLQATGGVNVKPGTPQSSEIAQANPATTEHAPTALMEPTLRPGRTSRMPIGNILVTGKRRACNPDGVRIIAESMRTIGQTTPIIVRAIDGAQPHTAELIDGLHRLEAAKLNGWADVECRYFEGDDIDARLCRIAEDLHRVELPVLDRSEYVEEWRELIRQKAGQVAHPAGGQQPSETGISKAAKELGYTREEVRRAGAIAGISVDAKLAIRKAQLDDVQSALLAIAKQSTPEAQLAQVQELSEQKRSRRRRVRDLGRESPAEHSPVKVTDASATAASGPPTERTHREIDFPDLPPQLDRRDPASVAAQSFEALKATWDAAPDFKRAWENANGVVRQRFVTEVLGLKQ